MRELNDEKMTHPLVYKVAPGMMGDLTKARAEVAQWLVRCESESERLLYRSFGAELGAVQRRMKLRPQPPSLEEVEIALTCVLALLKRAEQPQLNA